LLLPPWKQITIIMAADEERPDVLTPLLAGARVASKPSVVSSHPDQGEPSVADASVFERLPYNDYTTIDWLHELVR
jgi:hypothetical protein